MTQSYKYLGLEFNERLSWDMCGRKRLHGGWETTFLFQNRCKNVKEWDIICSLPSSHHSRKPIWL